MVLEHGLQIADHGLVATTSVDPQHERLDRRDAVTARALTAAPHGGEVGGRLAGGRDLLGSWLERLDLLHDELRLSALLVVDAPAHDHASVDTDLRLVA